MKRQIQRLLSLAVAVLFAASGYAYDVVVDGIYYDLNETERTASVTSGGSYAGSVSIPASITCGGTTYSVTSIGDWAFYVRTGLTSVTIPGSVTSIGSYAFRGCTGLTSVTIPESVTSIGNEAFFDCTSLTAVNVEADNPVFSSVDGVVYSKDKTFIFLFPGGKGGAFTIPESVTSIGDYAFSGCTGLTSVTIPGSVTNIGEGAFCYCVRLTSVTIPGSVTSIGSDAFRGCTGLTSVTIPESVTSIGDWAFLDCTGLTSVTIPESVTSIGDGAFSGCTGLTSVTIPNSVTILGVQAFYGCTGLTSVTIPESVTSIGDLAFCGCTGLTSVTIPESVTSIGEHAFYGCTGLTAINVAADNPVFSSVDGVVYSKDKTFIFLFPEGKGGAFTIPESVTSIGSGAFYGCTGLTSVTIPESVTSIGNSAFYGCTGLTSLVFPNSMATISIDAISGCSGLKELVFPEEVDKPFHIGSFAFQNNLSLEKLYLPSNATIGERAFAYTYYDNSKRTDLIAPLPNLKEISVGSISQEISLHFATDYASSSVLKYALADETAGKTVKCFTYVKTSGDSYHSIGVLLPVGLKFVIRDQDSFPDENMFHNTNGSLLIVLEKPLVEFHADLFKSTGIMEVAIDKSVEKLSTGMFMDCTSLQKLELPFPGAGTADAVSNFGELFMEKERVTSVGPTGTREVTQYFENGTTKTYFIPSSLRELVLAEGCEMIPYGGLSNCNMLESVTLPTSLYMVGDKAFYGCAKIGDIYCKGADPAVAYDGSFEGMRVSSCKLHVPYNTAELYKRSTGWENFYYFEEEAPLRITVTKSIENGGVVYGLNEYQPGQTAELRAVAHSGYTFEGWTEDGRLLTTADTYTFVVSESRALTAQFAPVMDENEVEVSAGGSAATFSYAAVEGAASYRIDVYRDRELTDLVRSVTDDTSAARAVRSAAQPLSLGVDGLDLGTVYYYALTALSGDGLVLSRFTGSFTTSEVDGIGDIRCAAPVTETGRYDATGRRLTAPARGLNIIRYSDGTTRKVVVK